MKHWLLATVSSLALTGGVATAADLPARMPVKAPVPPAVVQLWAGPYIGINGGAVWHRAETDTIYNPTVFAYDSATVKATGATFGGQLGYN